MSRSTREKAVFALERKTRLEPRWHPAPKTRYFVVDEVVRLDGERGGRYRIRGFRDEGGRTVVELFGAKGSLAPRLRTVPAERIRRI